MVTALESVSLSLVSEETGVSIAIVNASLLWAIDRFGFFGRVLFARFDAVRLIHSL